MAAALKQQVLEGGATPSLPAAPQLLFLASSILHKIKPKAQGWQNGSATKALVAQTCATRVQAPGSIER